MAIILDSIKRAFVDNKGNRNLDIVLEDDVANTKKIIRWCGDGNIPDDDVAARAIVNAEVDTLWAANYAEDYDDAPGNIDTPVKEYNSKKPDVNNIKAAQSVPALREQVAFLLEAVEELRKMVN